MNFKQCVADICSLIDAVDRDEISAASAKVTAIGTIAEYSDSRYEGFSRLMERQAQDGTTKTA